MTGLDPFVAALRHRTCATLTEHPPTADIVDVVDRALALEPEAVPEGLRERLGSAAATSDEPEAAAGDLAPFVTALRQRVQQTAAEHRFAPRPSPPERLRHWPIVLGVLAACLVGAVGLQFLGGTALLRDGITSRPNEAELLLEDRGPDNAVEASGPSTRPRTDRGDMPDEAALEPAPRLVDPPATEAERTPERPSKNTKLDELEARARSAWAAGELGRAERALRSVARRAGRSRRAELAYADLFSLAQQRGGASARSRVWKEYLKRFPTGRFSDDVRAGLCRRADGDGKQACWKRYLAKQPAGAHLSEARKVVLSSPTESP